MLSRFPRKSLAFLPTPLVELPRFSAALGRPGGVGRGGVGRGGGGPRIFMKRDDQTGLATGGNKARKLEFLVGEALAQGCDCLITGGAAQSNHCRQTAAAAAACGLGCHLVLGGEAPRARSDSAGSEGNLLLDLLFGAVIHWSGPRRKGEDMPAIAAELAAQGHRPYVIPYGGSNALGALGFAAAAGELAAQLKESGLEPTRIIFASSSGGTQGGLMVGARLFGLGGEKAGAGAAPELMGICIDKPETEGSDFADRVLAVANGAATLAGLPLPSGHPQGQHFTRDEVILRREFTGGGYGIVGELERGAISLLARSEGILVDPVYSGRALGALVSMVASGELGRDESLVFWHTGGTPAIFAYGGELFQA